VHRGDQPFVELRQLATRGLQLGQAPLDDVWRVKPLEGPPQLVVGLGRAAHEPLDTCLQ
jgi:hypothetical protein